MVTLLPAAATKRIWATDSIGPRFKVHLLHNGFCDSVAPFLSCGLSYLYNGADMTAFRNGFLRVRPEKRNLSEM